MSLEAEDHGVYLLLLMNYWKKGELIDDKKELIKIARLRPGKEAVLDNILKLYFLHENGRYVQKRIVEEIKKATARRTASRESGKLGGRPKGSKNKASKKPTKNLSVPEKKPRPNLDPNLEKSSSSSSSSLSSSLSLLIPEPNLPASPAGGSNHKNKEKDRSGTEAKECLDYYFQKHKADPPEGRGFEPMIDGPRDMKMFKRILKNYDVPGFKEVIDAFFEWPTRSDFTTRALYNKVDTLHGVLKRKAEGRR